MKKLDKCTEEHELLSTGVQCAYPQLHEKCLSNTGIHPMCAMKLKHLLQQLHGRFIPITLPWIMTSAVCKHYLTQKKSVVTGLVTLMVKELVPLILSNFQAATNPEML
jgi:hypothetical protein